MGEGTERSSEEILLNPTPSQIEHQLVNSPPPQPLSGRFLCCLPMVWCMDKQCLRGSINCSHRARLVLAGGGAHLRINSYVVTAELLFTVLKLPWAARGSKAERRSACGKHCRNGAPCAVPSAAVRLHLLPKRPGPLPEMGGPGAQPLGTRYTGPGTPWVFNPSLCLLPGPERCLAVSKDAGDVGD